MPTAAYWSRKYPVAEKNLLVIIKSKKHVTLQLINHRGEKHGDVLMSASTMEQDVRESIGGRWFSSEVGAQAAAELFAKRLHAIGQLQLTYERINQPGGRQYYCGKVTASAETARPMPSPTLIPSRPSDPIPSLPIAPPPPPPPPPPTAYPARTPDANQVKKVIDTLRGNGIFFVQKAHEPGAEPTAPIGVPAQTKQSRRKKAKLLRAQASFDHIAPDAISPFPPISPPRSRSHRSPCPT